MNIEEARARLYALQGTLLQITERDAEQHVEGVGLPVLSAVLGLLPDLVERDEVLRSVVQGLRSQADSGAPVRATDALLVVAQVLEALPPAPPPRYDRSGL